MDIKELGLEVKESRIEGILREIKEEIGKKDIRFIKLSDIHGRDIYINTNEIISIQEDSEDIDKGTITNITARWGMLLVLATPEEVLDAIKKAAVQNIKKEKDNERQKRNSKGIVLMGEYPKFIELHGKYGYDLQLKNYIYKQRNA